MLANPTKDIYGIAELESFRKQVITWPMEHTPHGEWVLKKRIPGFQKEQIQSWLKSTLSHDDYGYVKSEEDLPTDQDVEKAYEELLGKVLSDVSYKDDLYFSALPLNYWKGKKDRTIYWVMGYDEESFKGNENKDGIIATTTSIGARGVSTKQEYFENEGDALKALVTGAKGQTIRGKTDPVYYLRNLLSKKPR